VILGLLDEMPERVLAAGGSYLHPKIADVTMTLLEFASGVKAHIFVSWLHPFKEQKLVVVGDRKMAVFDDVRAEGKLVLYPHVIEWRNHAPVAQHAEAETVPTDSVEPLRAECSHFLECVRERARPLTDGEEGLRVLSVLEHCQDAIESRVGAKVVGRSREKRPYFVHESASVDEGVEIGEGTTIWHTSYIRKGSRVGKNCRIGRNVMIGPNVIVGDGVKIQDNISVYEGVTLEDAVFCGPAMVFTNVVNPRSEVPRMQELRRTLVKHGASLGANCTIICGRTIGTYAFVGAGAVVTRDVPDYAMVLGNPARFAWWMCACGVKLKIKDALGTCDDCGRNYRVVGGVRLEPAGESPKRVPGR
jgi:UDP-2-acetamido-3-amino-2,3-dideoxy-glucuronate N-acetyltransferase